MYLKSRHARELEVKGVLLPKEQYSDYEIKCGKRSIIEITEDQLNLLKTDKVFKSLVDKSRYIVTDKLPEQYATPIEKLKLKTENYVKIINEKDIEIAALKKENEELKKEFGVKQDEVEIVDEPEADKKKKESK
jgi:hypothetical protein